MESEKLQKILQVIIILYCILLAISGIRMIAGSDGVTVMLSIFIGCAKIALAILQGYFAVSIEKVDSGIMLKGFALSGIILLISFNFIFAIFSFAFAGMIQLFSFFLIEPCTAEILMLFLAHPNRLKWRANFAHLGIVQAVFSVS